MSLSNEYLSAIQTLKSWIADGNVSLETKSWKDGSQITETENLAFVIQAISQEELASIKIYTENKLPESYYHFLREIGSGQFFIGEFLPSFEIYNNAELREYNSMFQNEKQDCEEITLDDFMIIGSDCAMGDWMGFCTTKMDEKNFDVYCHEYPIDDYVATSDELNSWRTFEEWLIKAVETKGSKTL